MAELIQAGARTYYLESPSKIGLYVPPDGRAVLIDSGSHKDVAKKVLRGCAEKGWTVSAVLNTHSHADHIGGNRFLQEKTGCPVYGGGIELSFTRAPVLEPAFLWGASPIEPLRSRFLLAEPSLAEPFPDPLPGGLELLPLPGHCFEQVGFRTPDNVVFLADCLAGEAGLAKHPVSYLYDVRAYLDTLDRVEQLEAALFVPSHAPAAEDIRPLAERNRRQVTEILRAVEALCAVPRTFEELLRGLAGRFGLTLDFTQYGLISATLRAYLSYLYEDRRLSARFVDNRLLWQAAEPAKT